MGRGSKFKGPAAVGAAASTALGSNATATNGDNSGAGPSKKKHAGISDALRQAVLDLGGGEDDLDLIDGVDEDEDEPATKGEKSKSQGQSSEKDLKKALGDFMKGLDFAAAGAQMPAVEDDAIAQEDEDEDDSDEDSDEEEDDDEVEEDESSDEEEESEDEDEDESEEEAAPTPVKAAASKPAAKTPDATPIVPAEPNWPSLTPVLPQPPSPLIGVPLSKLQSLRSRATKLLEDLPPLSRKTSSSDAAFINQILQSGTHQDKLSALILLVRESPVHAVKELGKLRGMTGYKEDGSMTGGGGNKDQRVAVCKALVDWWVSGGGKESGKLKYFADQPLLAHPQLTDRHLLVFAFEDWLKKWFFNLLQVLETLSHDQLPYIRVQALQMVFRLLEGNAEQEQNLLRLGVNKLGDTEKSVASKTSHRLLQLLQIHPAMKAIVAREVSSLVLKPSPGAASASSSHVRFDDGPSSSSGKSAGGKPIKSDGAAHARYYGLITLNQITLSARTDRELAGKLVQLYFEVFRELLGEAEKEGAGANGENKEKEDIEKAVGKVGKWQGRRKRSDKGKGKGNGQDDEEVLESEAARLVAAVLTGIKRAVPYARLEEDVFAGYLNTLFKITHIGTFNTSIQALALVFQVSQAQAQTVPAASSSTTTTGTVKSITDRFYRTLYDSLLDPRLLSSSKQAMYLNLLFSALKADTEVKRVMAFVKRLCQLFGLMGVPFLSGALFLLGELCNTTPGLKRMLIEPEDEGEEHFVDAPESASAPENQQPGKANGHPNAQTLDNGYDGKKREPLYAHADTSCLWEIIPLTQHFHPSISLLSSQLLLSQPMSGSADISGNTLISFLDKFVYRNPKKNVAQKGASVMQPAAAAYDAGRVKMQKGAKVGSEMGVVNSEAFWRKKVGEVPVDQLFFHKYFSNKLAQKEKSKKRAGKDSDDESDEDIDDEQVDADSDADSDAADADEPADSDAEEDEIWKAMQASMPGAEDDLGLSDDSDIDIDDSDEGSDEEDGEAEDRDFASSAGSAIGSDDDIDLSGVDSGDDEEAQEEEEEDDDDDDDFPALSDEEEDLIPLDEMDMSDADMPNIVLDGGASSSDEEAAGAKGNGKRKRGPATDKQSAAAERKERRKKRKEMPLFGDYEMYQKMIEEAGNDGDE